jgi:hypothetical protein
MYSCIFPNFLSHFKINTNSNCINLYHSVVDHYFISGYKCLSIYVNNMRRKQTGEF